MAGYFLSIALLEILSARMFLVCCCEPSQPIPVIYPGIQLYTVEWFAMFFFSFLIVIFGFIISLSSGFMVMLFHNLISVIAIPLISKFIFFTSHIRVERDFQWIRSTFFQGIWWIIYTIVVLILFSPAWPGNYSIIATGLKNNARIARRGLLEVEVLP